MKIIIYSFIITLCLSSTSFAGEVIIIASKQCKLDAISKSEVKRLFTGKLRSVKGHRVKPVIFKKSVVHKHFLKSYAKRTSSQFDRAWTKLVFTGKAKMPQKFSDKEELMSNIADDELLIGYVEKEHIDDRVKILEIK